jgi:hypothetical protein
MVRCFANSFRSHFFSDVAFQQTINAIREVMKFQNTSGEKSNLDRKLHNCEVYNSKKKERKKEIIPSHIPSIRRYF